MDPTDANDACQLRYSNALHTFSLALLDLYHTNPWPEEHPALDRAISDLGTDLWKNGFSQSVIQKAYEALSLTFDFMEPVTKPDDRSCF